MELYAHPFSSFCQKALITLYENDTPLKFRLLEGEAAFAEVTALWPMRKFHMLRDREGTVVESTAIIEHLALHGSWWPTPCGKRETAIHMAWLMRSGCCPAGPTGTSSQPNKQSSPGCLQGDGLIRNSHAEFSLDSPSA
ncbi:hypothetical protein D3C72_1250890 [compost metagenome]